MMSSQDACDTIGCTYRQLDYLTRCCRLNGMNRGPGSRRQWDLSTVVRLTVAYKIAGTGDAAAFPDVANAALSPRLPDPPRRGYAVLALDTMTMAWASTWADLRRAIDANGAAIVARYDLDELVGDVVDLDVLASTALPR